MNKLYSTLLTGILSCFCLGVFANVGARDGETHKEINAVKIYRVYNPNESLSDNNKNSNLSIKFARGDKMPQYLIMLDESIKKESDHISARFLVNLKTRLAFVDGKLFGDSLLAIRNAGSTEEINIKTVNNDGEGEYSPALFSFRITDDNEDQNFLIESWAKNIGSMEGEWVKITDGIPIAVKTTLMDAKAGKADIFNLGIAQPPKTKATTDVEQLETKISVIADYGSVSVMGAEGKKIVMTNTLGQVIASETAGSDNYSITAPSGIVMISVDGQPAMKAVVK